MMKLPKICVRCGISKKLVKEEGSTGCYVYNNKVANRHKYIETSPLSEAISLLSYRRDRVVAELIKPITNLKIWKVINHNKAKCQM